MSKLVHKAQNALVEGRQVLDAALIATKVIDSTKKRKENSLCKLDIEKVYDQINWSFLLWVPGEMWFGEK